MKQGKIVDIYSEFADTIVRPTGGTTPAIPSWSRGRSLSSTLIPSGILHPGNKCVIANRGVIDPRFSSWRSTV